MISSSIQRVILVVTAVCLVVLPAAQTAHAAIITTDEAIAISDRSRQIENINTVLARESVQEVLVGFGVDPANAMARVDSLTPAELQTLEQRLADLPAGGVGVVQGDAEAVFKDGLGHGVTRDSS